MLPLSEGRFSVVGAVSAPTAAQTMHDQIFVSFIADE